MTRDLEKPNEALSMNDQTLTWYSSPCLLQLVYIFGATYVVLHKSQFLQHLRSDSEAWKDIVMHDHDDNLQIKGSSNNEFH